MATALIHLMARRQRLVPIQTRKEIVDSTLLAVTAATPTTVVIASAVNDYTGTVATFPTGSSIKSIFLFVQGLPTAGTANVDWYLQKAPANVLQPVPGATGGTVQRRFILHEEKGIPGNASDGAYPSTFKGVLKIPKGMQRFAEGDVMVIEVRGTDISNWCIKCIYKVWL